MTRPAHGALYPLIDDDPCLALAAAIVKKAVDDAQSADPRLRQEATDFLERFAPSVHRLLFGKGGPQRKKSTRATPDSQPASPKSPCKP